MYNYSNPRLIREDIQNICEKQIQMAVFQASFAKYTKYWPFQYSMEKAYM